MKYSTVASGTDMSDPMQDITHHYTFGFDTLVNGTGSEKTTEITKYGVKTTTELDNKVALDGAQFQLLMQMESSYILPVLVNILPRQVEHMIILYQKTMVS